MTFRPRLWRVMEAADGDTDKLRALLADASAEQMLYLDNRYLRAAAELRDVPEFWDHAAGPREADQLARWVVTQGRDAWFAAQRDPSQLPREPPPSFQDFSPLIAELYKERFGVPMPLDEADPARDPNLMHSPEWEATLWKLIDYMNVGALPSEALDGFTRSDLARLGLAFD